MSDHLAFKGVTQIFRDNLATNILYGTVDFFNWAALGVGGFQNITYNPKISGCYGGDRSQLRPVADPRYPTNTVFEGFRGNWVWESGVGAVNISGIYVDQSYTTSGYYVDYTRGRIIFNNPVSGTINTSFSHRTVTFAPARGTIVPDLFFASYRNESTDFLAGSGNYSSLSDTKRQLPMVCVDIDSNRRFKPYQLGGGQWCMIDAAFYVIAESDYEKNSLVDLISLQNDKTFWIPNRATIKESGQYPLDLDYKGSLVNTPTQYPEVIEKFPWRKISFSDTRVHNYEPKPYNGIKLYVSVVSTTFIVSMENI